MSLAELAVVIFFAVLLGAAAMVWHDRQREAQLGLDLARVQETARRYAAARCTSPPAAPVPLADVLSELGSGPLGIGNPERWTVVVSARPGRMGTVAAVRYASDATAWQITHLLGSRNAARVADGVELPVEDRRRIAPNQGSFRHLLENRSC